MVRRNVIVRKLDALEALGGVTDICSDKTGTLTRGVMTARAAWLPGVGLYSIADTESPFDPTLGTISLAARTTLSATAEGEPAIPLVETPVPDLLKSAPTLEGMLNVASMCNLATVKFEEGEWKVRGDPTECAIQVFVKRFGFGREELAEQESSEWSAVAEFPFDSDFKRMSVIFGKNGLVWYFFPFVPILTRCGVENNSSSPRELLSESSCAVRQS